MIDLTVFNSVCLSAFAEAVVFNLTGGDVELQAVFDIEKQKGDIGGAPFSADYYTLSLLQSDMVTHGIALRNTVHVRDISYQILEMTDDTTGMATLKIRRYQ